MTIQEQIQAIATPVAEQLGLEIVEVEWLREAGRRILRVTIDRPGGISHEHCEQVSRALDTALDEAAVLPDERFHLEVSSPGAERQLKTEADFKRFAGRRVLVRAKSPVEGRREWRGNLVGADDDKVVVAAEAGEISVPRDLVTRVRLSID